MDGWHWCIVTSVMALVHSCGGCSSSCGAVGSVEVDGPSGFAVSDVVCTLGADVLVTLRAGLFSLLSDTLAASLKISVSCHSACVCFGLRSIGAFDSFCIATMMRSCATRRTVSPGSIAGILQCAGKNFADTEMRYPFVSGMKN